MSKSHIDASVLVKEIQSYQPHFDLSLLEKAIHFSSQAHDGQKRVSGDPYFIHPLGVALILSRMKMDLSSIIAGLLHDTVEDTSVSLEEIEKNFGSEIKNLVDGVTKLGKIKFSSSQQKQAENFRKMVMAMAKDIRVILIKLADRLHNMRTLSCMAHEKQAKIAKETLDIYAPLANRLGIQWMKVELEDLSFKFHKPESFELVSHKLADMKEASDAYVKRVLSTLVPKLTEYHVPHEMVGRLKHAFSVYRKMHANNLAFEQVNDLMAFRIIVDSIPQCYTALGIIHELWTPIPGRFKDYIAMPKANNYQSLHTTVICLDGQRAEFQIRTRQMHEIAEKGIAAHWKYKEKEEAAEIDQKKFQWLRELLNWQQELKDPAEFLDTVKLDLFATDVYVFTPKGEVKELPQGSTPIDFAYSIHSDVGNRCVGARVNDKIVPLSYRLNSGDTIEILTQANQKPSKDWLKIAASSRARSKIRFVIRQEQRERSIQIGKDLLEKELARFHLPSLKNIDPSTLQTILSDFGLSHLDALAMRVGYGKTPALTLISKLLPKEKIQEEIEKAEVPQSGFLSQLFRRVKEKSKSVVEVGGFNDVLVTMGRCCSPLPGDPIVGFITRGRGVTVHLSDCAKVLATDSERRVDVSWIDDPNSFYQTKLKVVSSNRPGLLASMSKTISNEGVNISQASIRTTSDEKAVNIFEIEIKGIAQLQSVTRALEKISGVINVERIKG